MDCENIQKYEILYIVGNNLMLRFAAELWSVWVLRLSLGSCAICAICFSWRPHLTRPVRPARTPAAPVALPHRSLSRRPHRSRPSRVSSRRSPNCSSGARSFPSTASSSRFCFAIMRVCSSNSCTIKYERSIPVFNYSTFQAHNSLIFVSAKPIYLYVCSYWCGLTMINSTLRGVEVESNMRDLKIISHSLRFVVNVYTRNNYRQE